MFPAGLEPARALAATRFLRGRNRPAKAPGSLRRPSAPLPLPGLDGLAAPTAAGQTSCGGRASGPRLRLKHVPAPPRTAGAGLGSSPSPGPSGGAAPRAKQAPPPGRDAERGPQPGTPAGSSKREGTKPAKPQPPPRSEGPLAAAGASQRSPLPARRHVRGREALLPPTLILLSTPLLSSVCTSRSRSSVSSSVAAAAILFLPDNRPNCASGRTSAADSPPLPLEAPARRRTRGNEARRSRRPPSVPLRKGTRRYRGHPAPLPPAAPGNCGGE